MLHLYWSLFIAFDFKACTGCILLTSDNIVVIYLDKGKTAKEEARELQLKEEASVRERVCEIQKNLSLMLRALGDMAIANSVFAHSRLPSMVLSCCLLVFVDLLLYV